MFFIVDNNDNSDFVSGYFSGLQDPNGAISTDDPTVASLSNANYLMKISYTGNLNATDITQSTLTGGNDIVLYTVAVPEPASLAMAAVAGAGLIARRRRVGRA
jgi:hypothetical protein